MLIKDFDRSHFLKYGTLLTDGTLYYSHYRLLLSHPREAECAGCVPIGKIQNAFPTTLRSEGFLVFRALKGATYQTFMTETLTHNSEAVLALTRRRLEAAPQALAVGQPVVYYIQETTQLGGRHGAFALHRPKQDELHLTIPNRGAEIVMTLHALEAALHGILKAQQAGTEVDFPTLHFHDRGQLPTHKLTQEPVVIRVSLNVQVPETHLIVTHRNFRSKDLSLRQVVEQYYELLVERLHAQTQLEILQSFPVNTMLVHAARGVETPDKDRIGVVINGHKEHSRDHYPLVYPAKINALTWQHGSTTGPADSEERNS